MTPTDLIARQRAIEQAATPGPWFDDYGKVGAADSGIGEMDAPEDAVLIVAARNDRALLLDVVEAAVEYDAVVTQMAEGRGDRVWEAKYNAANRRRRTALDALFAAWETERCTV